MGRGLLRHGAAVLCTAAAPAGPAVAEETPKRGGMLT